MKWIANGIMKHSDASGTITLAIEANVNGVTHFGFVWIKGRSPTNCMDELIAFVLSSKEKKESLAKRISRKNKKYPCNVVWYDIQRPFVGEENNNDARRLKYRRVGFEGEELMWSGVISFDQLPVNFQEEIKRKISIIELSAFEGGD